MKIGEAAKKCGLSVKTVRYYTDIDLISPARRENDYRDFDEATIAKLILVGRARSLDFSISECAEILEIAEADPAKQRLYGGQIEHLIAKLAARRDDIKELQKLLIRSTSV